MEYFVLQTMLGMVLSRLELVHQSLRELGVSDVAIREPGISDSAEGS